MKIGFVDHHLNNYHANKFLSLLHGPLTELGARVSLAWESDPTGEDWCAKNAIPRAESAAEVAERCDAVMVLAPDNIEAHAELCAHVFPSGKRCLVDKFLAPTREEAGRIVDLAARHGVELFSASSLRFAVELEAALAEAEGPAVEAYGRGMGEWNGYGVHTLSLVLAAMGGGARRLVNTGTEHSTTVTLEYADGRRGWVVVRAAANQWEAFPWSFGFRIGDRYVTGTVAEFDGFYANLMRRSVHFFQTGESPVSTEEMLEVAAVLEGANRSREQEGAWIEIGPQ